MPVTALLIDGGKPVSAALPQAVAALGRASLVWVDADERTPEVDALLATLRLHPLTVEDVYEKRSTPKVEDFGKYLYILALPHMNFQEVYGPFALAVTMMVWAFFSGLLLLAGAHLSVGERREK